MLLAASYLSTASDAACDALVPAHFPTIQAAIDASPDATVHRWSTTPRRTMTPV